MSRSKVRRGRPGQYRPHRPRRPEEIEPVRIETGTAPKEQERVALFYIGEREYTIPKRLPPATGLRYLREVAEFGADQAVYNLMVEVLGQRGYDDLADCDDVTRDQLKVIVDTVIDLALGTVDSEGN